MAVMYSDLSYEEKQETFKQSTVKSKTNQTIHWLYCILLTGILISFQVYQVKSFDSSPDDQSAEQILIQGWLGNVSAIWWLTAGLSILRVILTVVLLIALANFWVALDQPKASQSNDDGGKNGDK